jgi:hypothetical protein
MMVMIMNMNDDVGVGVCVCVRWGKEGGKKETIYFGVDPCITKCVIGTG